MPSLSRNRFFPSAALDVVVIAASAGGVGALKEILVLLPGDFPAPVLVVQHRAPQSSDPSRLRWVLSRGTRLRVSQAANGDRLQAGTVHVAPPDHHLLIRQGGACRLSSGAKVHSTRPAADPLFHSAAVCYGERALGVVLTGAGCDGTDGAHAIRRRGGVVIAQQPSTCFSPFMPQAVVDAGRAQFVLAPAAIAHALTSLTMVPGATALFGVQAASGGRHIGQS